MSLKAQLDKIKNKPIPFELFGSTWYMKNLTVDEVKTLQDKFNSETDDSLLHLFTDVIVDENGDVYDEIKDGMTFEELQSLIPVMVLRGLAEAIAEVLTGQSEGN